LAVNPDDANQIIGLTADAVLTSRDGGRSWQPSDSLRLHHVVWPEAAKLWGVDQAGGVSVSSDAGATWQHQGSLAGTAEAFHATHFTLYAAVYDEATGIVIYASVDGGKTWQERYHDPPVVTG
jgi:photosystem II stability/assembly factor-like uncharacterized protein